MKRIFCAFIILLNCSVIATAQQREIKGTVKDENGTALIGATVKVTGTTNGKTTDASGSFILTVKAGDSSLQVSYLGYQDKEVPISDKNFIPIVLRPKAVGLNEVVAIGYGTQKKVNLTGSVASIDGDDLVKRPVMRASAALEGMASGVTVRQTSGAPGGDGGDIKVRGIGTLGNADPLILIDGIEGNLDGIDPNDIESISVLKDAASAAIYGSRAANGVILVTTKRGASEKLRVNYNAYFGWQRFTDLPEFADGYTYMKTFNMAYENEGKDPIYSEAYLQEYKENYLTDPDHYPNVDWQDIVYTGSGFLQHQNLSIAGGNKFIQVRGSLSYQDQKGQIPRYRSQRYSFRLNTQMNVLDNLQLRFDLSGRHAPTFAPARANTILSETERIPPIFPALLSNGHYGVGWSGTNPLAIAEIGGWIQHNYETLRGTLQANYQPFKGADIEFKFSPRYRDKWGKGFTRSIDTYEPDSDVPVYTKPTKDALSESDLRRLETTLQLLLKYSKSLNEVHNIDLLFGYEQISYMENFFDASRKGFPLPDYQELDAGSISEWENGGTASSWALRSWFGRLNYNFKSKYLFEANLRIDGSSRFAEGNKYGVFPSFSAGWRVSEENFLKDVAWLSNLKLRASYGVLGNQLISGGVLDNQLLGTYPFASVIDLGVNYIFNNQPANGGAQANMSNRNITWESTATRDIGVDIDLFRNRLGITFDYYTKKTTDIILQLPIPYIVGLAAPYQNAGVVKNTGWDLSVRYRNQSKALKYNIGLNISDVKNEVVDLRGTGPYISTYSIIKEGYPINELYGYKAIGLFRDEKEIENHAKQFGNYAPGDIMFKDVNGDDIINEKDRVALGSQLPRFTFGLNFSAEYHNFDLSFLIQGVGKRSIFLYKDAVWAFYNSGKIQTWQLDYWTPDNLDSKYPRLIAGSNHNNFENSSFWVFNASYVRLKNLQIGYSLPQSVLSHTFIDRLRIYVSGENILTKDRMPAGWDPERNSGDTKVYPISSTYIFGLNLAF